MSDVKTRTIGVILSLVVLGCLSLYSVREIPQHRPHTIDLLENPGRYEGELIPGMVGEFLKYENREKSLILVLERFGETFQVKPSFEMMDWPDELEKGDLVHVSGYSYIQSKGFVEAVELQRRPRGRNTRLYLFSFAGFGFLLFVIFRDRERLLEAVGLG